MIQRILTGDRRVPFRIGLGYSLVASVVGIAQWVLTERDLAVRVTWFQDAQLSDPGFFDYTPVAKGNEWFWLTTAAETAGVMLILYILAAFTAGWVSQHQQGGVFAAWIAAAVSGVIYVAATIVAVASGPDPSVTGSLAPCELFYGLVLFGILLPLAVAGARIGTSARRSFSHSRRV